MFIMKLNEGKKYVGINSEDYGYACWKLVDNKTIDNVSVVQCITNIKCEKCLRTTMDYNVLFLSTINWDINFDDLFKTMYKSGRLLMWRCPCGAIWI